MTASRAVALFLSVGMAGALAHASGAGPVSSTTAVARLTAISARTHVKGASLVIEASQPVAYVAMRPDALTVVIDFRNVGADGVANSVVPSANSPIAAVSVEPSEALGAPASRVRIRLAQPVVHHVRSERNTIVVDFEKPSANAAQYATASAVRPAAPDAMKALEPTLADPIVAMKLDTPSVPQAILVAAAVGAAPNPTPAAGVAAPLPARAIVVAAPSAKPAVVVAGPIPAPAPDRSSTPAFLAPSAAVQAPPPPQPPAADQPGAARTPGRFTGHPVSLDFQGADLRAVLRTFAEISGLNMVIDPAVQGTVDVALRDVPWDQALDIILRANKLGYLVDGTIVRIAPLSALADEENQRRKLTDEQALAGELRVLTKTLSYAKAEELRDLLTKSALSPRGTVQVDPRTNTLIITDLSDRLTTANDLIATLDRAQPQVEIEARIVQATKNYARAFGIQWGFNGRVDPTLGNTTGLAFPNNGSLGGRVGVQGPGATSTAVNLPASAPSSAVGLALGAINGAFNLDVALTAAESTGNVHIISSPRVSTTNNNEAEITQGTQIPIQTIANNTITVTFKDAALTLKVTPQITSSNTVIMKISLENAVADFSKAVNGIPPINTQRAITQVLVSDGQTTVIGGIYASNQAVKNDSTPGISRIPLIKWLFKRDDIADSSSELLIFITPRIIKS